MPKLLIVDDSEPFVNSAVDFFRLEGWEAVGVASAEEAVKVVDPSFDAVLLDWSMPGMTGGELLALLRKRQYLRGTAIAIYTAYGTLQSAIESLKTGADDYLIKPLDLIVLEKQLTEIINKRRASVTSEHPQLRVFLCHASQDKPDVRKLHTRLKHDGYSPWLDEAELVGGQDWDLEIRRAVRSSDVVIVCLSQTAVGKTGYLQKEIKQALDIADEQPEGTIFIIPLKLDDCEVPDRLGRWQWIHLNQRGGYQQLLRSLRRRTK